MRLDFLPPNPSGVTWSQILQLSAGATDGPGRAHELFPRIKLDARRLSSSPSVRSSQFGQCLFIIYFFSANIGEISKLVANKSELPSLETHQILLHESHLGHIIRSIRLLNLIQEHTSSIDLRFTYPAERARDLSFRSRSQAQVATRIDQLSGSRGVSPQPPRARN